MNVYVKFLFRTGTNCAPPQAAVVGNPQAAVANPPQAAVAGPAPAAAAGAPPAQNNNNNNNNNSGDDSDLQPVPAAIPAAIPGPSGEGDGPNASNYNSSRKGKKRSGATNAEFQERLLATLAESQSDVGDDDDEVDLAVAAMCKRIKNIEDPEARDNVIDELQQVVSRHVRRYRNRGRGGQQNGGIPQAPLMQHHVPVPGHQQQAQVLLPQAAVAPNPVQMQMGQQPQAAANVVQLQQQPQASPNGVHLQIQDSDDDAPLQFYYEGNNRYENL